MSEVERWSTRLDGLLGIGWTVVSVSDGPLWTVNWYTALNLLHNEEIARS